MVGNFADFYVFGKLGVLTMERNFTGVATPWETILRANLPEGYGAVKYVGAPVSVDDMPDITLIMTVDNDGEVCIKNRSSLNADFKNGEYVYGCMVFPLK